MIEENREQQICKAWAKEADCVDELKVLCKQLAEATETLCAVSQEFAITDGTWPRRIANAIVNCQSALEAAKKAGIING